jgi:hypothetical protein
VKTAWTWYGVVLAAASLLSPGCAKFDLRKNIPWGEGKDGAIEQPMRVETVWVDTVMTRNNEAPKRGFGGRLYFFGPNNSQEPVKVDGTLVVYAFNETNRNPTNVVPDRKIVYPVKDFETLYSKSKLGHSYSVWVPWDEAGGPQTEITLLARFIPKKGAVITSEQMKVLLPGVNKPLIDVRNVNSFQSSGPAQYSSSDMAGAAPAGGGVQQASFQQPAPTTTSQPDEGTKHGRRISSLTIPLRGPQANHFVTRSYASGGAQVGTLAVPDASGIANGSLNGNLPPAMQNAPAPSAQLPNALQQGQLSPSQSARPIEIPQQSQARYAPGSHPARAGPTAPPHSWRAHLEQRPAAWQSYLASAQSRVTKLPQSGYAPSDRPPSTPGPTDSAPAGQTLR